MGGHESVNILRKISAGSGTFLNAYHRYSQSLIARFPTFKRRLREPNASERGHEREEDGKEAKKKKNINVVRTYLSSAIRARGGRPPPTPFADPLFLAGVLRNFWPLNGPGSVAVLAFPLIKAPQRTLFRRSRSSGARN